MKKSYTLCLMAFFLISLNLSSQDFWEPATLPTPGAAIVQMIVDNTGKLIVATQDDIYYSLDYGDTWTGSSNWPGHTASCMALNASQDIFVGTQSNGIYRSTDGGDSFTEIVNGLTFMNVWSIVITDTDDIFISTSGGIFKSTNNGDLWSLFGSGLPNDDAGSLMIVDNGDMFAGFWNSGIYKSTDGGTTWNKSNGGLADTASITALGYKPGGNLYAGVWPDGMYRSADGGATWQFYNNGLPTKGDSKGNSIHMILWLAFAMVMVILIYAVGFFYLTSDTTGYIWAALMSGLPLNPSVIAMAAILSSGMLFLGTWDQGLYRSTGTVGVYEISVSSNDYSISPNYPNPFESSTSFEFTVQKNTFVYIGIYDQSGKQIEILVQGFYHKGSYIITWKPEDLSPGIYYYHMNSGNYQSSGKFVYTGS